MTDVNNNSTKSWTVFDNLPPDDKIDDKLFIKPFNDLFEALEKEFSEININVILEQFIKITPVFYSMSRPYRESYPKYNAIFTKFLDTLCSAYNINIDKLVYVQIGSIDEWGPVYWTFLHLASILINYAFEKQKIKYFLHFATLIYHIDLILPCNICAAHYKAIKYPKPHVKYDIQGLMIKIAYGLPMYGLQIFHNIISRNISEGNINRPEIKMFDISNFAMTYKCILSYDETTKLSTKYIKSVIDWQPHTHYLLCIILSKYMMIPYSYISDMLKEKLYSKYIVLTKFPLKHKNKFIFDNQRQFNEKITGFFSLSINQIKYLIVQALNLQFQHTPYTREIIDNDEQFKNAIDDFYRMYPKFINDLKIKKIAKY